MWKPQMCRINVYIFMQRTFYARTDNKHILPPLQSIIWVVSVPETVHINRLVNLVVYSFVCLSHRQLLGEAFWGDCFWRCCKYFVYVSFIYLWKSTQFSKSHFQGRHTRKHWRECQVKVQKTVPKGSMIPGVLRRVQTWNATCPVSYLVWYF